MKIVADPNIPFVREAFSSLGDIQLVPGRTIFATDVRDAEILLVRSVTPVNAALLEGSKVAFVATATIGTDHIDTEYLAQRGIGFASASGSNANSVAEYVVAAMLELAHGLKFRLREKTLGVVGVGNVGSRVVRYADTLGMRVLQNDPPRQRVEKSGAFVSLEEVLAESDILTLHVPLTESGPDATFHLLDGLRLSALAQKPILINTARGGVVDNDALLNAIEQGKLGGTVLDVWESEPNISKPLLAKVDIGTPHIAGYSFDGKVNGTTMIYQAVCQFLGRKPTWDPAPLMPKPAVPKINVNPKVGEDEESVLRDAIRQVYDIRKDDATLRARTDEFDKLRADYPVRREFMNTRVEAKGVPDSLLKKLRALGFQAA